MKASHFFAAALLGLATTFSAHAQTPVVGPTTTMPTPGAPAAPAAGVGAIVPGQPSPALSGASAGSVLGTGTLPAGTTTPIGTAGTMSPTGMLTRTVDGGTLTPGQPMATPGAAGMQSTRRTNATRTRTTSGTVTRP